MGSNPGNLLKSFLLYSMYRSRICHEQPSGALVFLLRGICEFRISHFSKQLISKQLQFLMLLIISVLKIATVLEFILQNVQKILKRDV